MGITPFPSLATQSNPYANAFTQQPDMLNDYLGASQGFNAFTNTTPAYGNAGYQNSFTTPGYGVQDAFQNKYTQQTGFSDAESSRGNYAGLGKTSQVGGNWAALDRFNPELEAAANQYGVPVNLLKSMVNRESSGNWERDNRIHTGFRGQRMLPFVGIFEDAAKSWGLDFDSMIGNRQAQIAGMARILNGLSQKYGGYENAAKVYFGGEQALKGGFTDELGMDSNTYGNTAVNDWKYLDGLSGSSSAYGGGTANIASFVPNGQLYDWGEFGTDSDNGLYGYGTQYGLNGRQHTGADIVGRRGDPYIAPMGGTVMCAGTGVGQGADGSGCAAFGDTGGGAGRVEVLLDNGAVLIYGHSAASALRPGQKFNAGDVLGSIGTMNSDHVHLEARVRDPSTPSGWRIVDPRSVISNGGMPTAGYTQPQKQSFSSVWQRYLGKK